MAIRDTLIANVTTAISGTGFFISSELPWTSGGELLYNKNMKTIYFSEEQKSVEQFIQTLDSNDVENDTISLTAYVTVDAKTQPTNTSNVITSLVSAKGAVANVYDISAEVTNSIEVDKITYSVEYVFNQI